MIILRPDHARFDVFINGQFILDADYIFEQVGKDFSSNLKKKTLVTLVGSDKISVEGDLQRL